MALHPKNKRRRRKALQKAIRRRGGNVGKAAKGANPKSTRTQINEERHESYEATRRYPSWWNTY
ncbi:MAG: hypothetical protein KBD55_02885 [Candidatus Pacebacteria bacterium]|nr:hypothetical protein [Candidatus Paceibacterota bacterium]